LARGLLSGEVRDGSTVRVGVDSAQETLTLV
jgi:ATP-dependent Clp protease ATP-binding subunit ClpB